MRRIKFFSIAIGFLIIYILFIKKNNIYGIKSSNTTSNLQLIARAINGEARGEPYEGQVAVRSSYFK